MLSRVIRLVVKVMHQYHIFKTDGIQRQNVFIMANTDSNLISRITYTKLQEIEISVEI